MKLYQELYGFYFLLIVLSIILVMLLVVFFFRKFQDKRKNAEVNLIGMHSALEETSTLEKATAGEKELMDEESSLEKSNLENTDELVEENSSKDEKANEPVNDAEEISRHEEVTEGVKVKRKRESDIPLNQLYDRYQLVKEELSDRGKYAMAYKGLVNKVNELRKDLVTFIEKIEAGCDVEEAEQIATTINESFDKVEKDIKLVSVLVEISQKVIPNMMEDKLTEIEKYRSKGVKVDKEILLVLKEAKEELVVVTSKIKAMELEGLLDELIEIVEKVDAISVKEKSS